MLRAETHRTQPAPGPHWPALNGHVSPFCSLVFMVTKKQLAALLQRCLFLVDCLTLTPIWWLWAPASEKESLCLCGEVGAHFLPSHPYPRVGQRPRPSPRPWSPQHPLPCLAQWGRAQQLWVWGGNSVLSWPLRPPPNI